MFRRLHPCLRLCLPCSRKHRLARLRTCRHRKERMRLVPRASAKLRMARGLVLRNWVALFLQERREKRASPAVAPPAPVITNAVFEDQATDAGYEDAVI